MQIAELQRTNSSNFFVFSIENKISRSAIACFSWIAGAATLVGIYTVIPFPLFILGNICSIKVIYNYFKDINKPNIIYKATLVALIIINYTAGFAFIGFIGTSLSCVAAALKIFSNMSVALTTLEHALIICGVGLPLVSKTHQFARYFFEAIGENLSKFREIDCDNLTNIAELKTVREFICRYRGSLLKFLPVAVLNQFFRKAPLHMDKNELKIFMLQPGEYGIEQDKFLEDILKDGSFDRVLGKLTAFETEAEEISLFCSQLDAHIKKADTLEELDELLEKMAHHTKQSIELIKILSIVTFKSQLESCNKHMFNPAEVNKIPYHAEQALKIIKLISLMPLTETDKRYVEQLKLNYQKILEAISNNLLFTSRLYDSILSITNLLYLGKSSEMLASLKTDLENHYSKYLISDNQNPYRQKLYRKKRAFEIEEDPETPTTELLYLNEANCRKYLLNLDISIRDNCSIKTFQEELDKCSLGTLAQLKEQNFPLNGSSEEKENALIERIKLYRKKNKGVFLFPPSHALSEKLTSIVRIAKKCFIEMTLWAARSLALLNNPILFSFSFAFAALYVANDPFNDYIPDSDTIIYPKNSMQKAARLYAQALIINGVWAISSGYLTGRALLRLGRRAHRLLRNRES